MTAPALEVRRLTVTYPNGFRGLSGIDLVVPDGGRLGVVGSSGCGKTTLVRTVLGLLPHGTEVTGSVRVGGREVTGCAERELRRRRGREIGYVAQDPYAACDPLHRVERHVAEAWTAHGLRPPEGAVVERLTGVGIPDAGRRAAQYPHQWSGGMLQRATTVAGTAHEPLLTLADEPTSALDAELSDGVLELLRRSCRSLVLVSHDLALVARHTDEVLVLDHGRVVEHGAAGTVLGRPGHEVTRLLVAASTPLPRMRPAHPVPTRAAPVVRLTGVGRTYATGAAALPAVRDVDLDVGAGEVVGVVGRSGSGKSTLLRLAAGLEPPDGGRVELAGADAWPRHRRRRAVRPRRGWVMPVFQDPVASLDRRWPLWRTVTEPLVVTGTRLSRAERRRRTAAALALVGLANLDVDRLPATLSVGQCQRVAVVRALIAGPALVVADEPTASLDVHAAAAVAALLREAADDGAAVLVVSHDEPRLASYADRLVRMTDGELCLPAQ
ncbi:ATP-binding cassette domain-containing protein [Modestobacter sp. VKM Ac-2979]|uniref:ABC transporter ATP-binding protein n=1 Tax=unclassified Modestobacter TaxID=2643866 RepID=UPI0022AB8697|nr:MULTISPECIES: ATP-binding cassette domain-containing protein [unclassified Modestobacter]MCZ2812011.1 ATP-binding cassette domain-containing protein [Modestobacter sp. VKM Ac-2979]MCZ2843735.1 ATP-binding cassette domain-containing protein [Modestobacter sp. VKM Ac-2980]